MIFENLILKFLILGPFGDSFCVHAVPYSHRPAKVCLILVSPHYRSLAAESSIRYVHAPSCRMMRSLPLLLTLFSHPPPFLFYRYFSFSVVFHRSFLLSASSFLIGISLLSTFVFDGGIVKIIDSDFFTFSLEK